MKTEECEYLRNDKGSYECLYVGACKDKFNYGGRNYCGRELGMNRFWRFKKPRKNLDKEVKNGYGYEMEKEK